MNNNLSKKKTNKKPTKKKNKLCKNNICVDTRTINDVLRKNIEKDKRSYHCNLLYRKHLFFNLEENQFYDTDKLLQYHTLKDKKGFLIHSEFNYSIDKTYGEDKKPTHTMEVNGYFYFVYHPQEQMKQKRMDAAFDGGDTNIDPKSITHPYTFSFKGDFFKDHETLKNRIIESFTIKSDKYTFLEFIDAYISEMKSNAEFKKHILTIEKYEATYKELLSKYYNESVDTDSDIFDIDSY